ncbi:hypothetical protein [Bradyrhizobium sp. USDA 4448]
MTYTFDNYTNTAVQATLAAPKNLIFQLGSTIGTEAMLGLGAKIANTNTNPLYPGTTMLKDPGAKPSVTLGVPYTTDSGNDSINVVADGINDGVWGYNNLQWYGLTYYHKFNPHLVREWLKLIAAGKNPARVEEAARDAQIEKDAKTLTERTYTVDECRQLLRTLRIEHGIRKLCERHLRELLTRSLGFAPARLLRLGELAALDASPNDFDDGNSHENEQEL